MTDRLDRLEAELSALTPRRLSADIFDGIDAGLRERPARRWGDRMLICSMCSGAIAACVILATLLRQPPASLPFPSPMKSATDAPRFGDYPLALARADSGMFDRVK